MKTSNIVLTIFLVGFLFYWIGVFAEIRVRGEYIGDSYVRNSEVICKESQAITLPSFEVINLSGLKFNGFIELKGVGPSTIEVYATEEIKTEVYYRVANDTLYIDRVDPMPVCESFQLSLGTMKPSIVMDSMSVNLIFKDSLEQLSISGRAMKVVTQVLPDSSLFIKEMKVSLDFQSDIFMNQPFIIDQLTGTVNNSSKFHLNSCMLKSANVGLGRRSSIIRGETYMNPSYMGGVTLSYQQGQVNQ
ncbi:hypothetical protein [Marinoscillum pacificum]|uniref:hypothetical protein n=1 Tax=Marinoscillum pacificum TaxID=392723 RepID=UPI00215785AB|nr:hypothetical protein [Marinoscillum pacificum]